MPYICFHNTYKNLNISLVTELIIIILDISKIKEFRGLFSLKPGSEPSKILASIRVARYLENQTLDCS